MDLKSTMSGPLYTVIKCKSLLLGGVWPQFRGETVTTTTTVTATAT